MIQLQILTGKQAGTKVLARHFPFKVGRENGLDLVLTDQGVWGRHLELQLRPDDRFWAVQISDALMVVDGQKGREIELTNGGLIELGSVKLRFALAEKPQRNLAFRETLIWIALIGLVLFQMACIHFLMR